jgi:tetratricopeptide (TPR) repeat protein
LEAIQLKRHRIIFAFLFGLSVALFGAVRSHAQTTRANTVIQETDDEVKVAVYRQFFENRIPNPAIAYQAAKEYMRRYGKEEDPYTRYFKIWIPAYEEDERERRLAAEREDREQRLLQMITQKKFADAYAQARQVLSDDPNNVKVLIPLGYAAVIASTETKNETFNADATNYALKAIQLIESGKAPESWSPFKNREDVLASLHYAVGFYSLKSNPDNAITHLIRAAQLESDRKTAPSTFYYLAIAYQNGPYQKLSADYGKRFANQPETPESKIALDTLNRVIDKIIDAYARAIALAGNDSQHQASKAEWTKRLTELYKFRHEGSDAGLSEFIAGVLSKPLPS